MSGSDDRLLASILDGSADAIMAMTPDGVLTKWNATAERLYGVTAKQALGQSIATLTELGEAYHEHAMAAAAGRMSSFGVEQVRRDGSQVEFVVTFSPLCDKTGTVLGVWCAARVATESKRTEREFVRLADAAEYGTDAVVSMDFDGYVRHWNLGAERLYGVSAEEAIGKRISDVNALTGEPEASNARARDAIARVMRGESAFHTEARRRRKDGVLIDVLATVTPWHVDGRLAGITTTAIDITERKRVEEAAANLAAIVQSSDDAIIGQTLGGQITSWNPAAEQIYGYDAAEAVGSHIVSLAAPGREDELGRLLDRVAAGERVIELETVHRRRDGRLIEVSMTTTPIADRDGRIVSAATVACDITERKGAERELERLAQAAEHGSDAVMSVDLDGRIRHFNQGAERMSGVSARAAIGLTGAEFNVRSGAGEERTGPALGHIARALAGEVVRYDAQRTRSDGTVLDLRTTLTPWLRDGKVIGVTSTTVDVTERRTAERELERLAQAAEHSSDSVMSFDRDGRIRHFNRGAERISGFSAGEMIGLSIAEWGALSGEGEELTGQLSPLVERALAGEVVRYEARRRRKDGTVIDLQATLTPWLSDGEVVGVTSTASDITERKAAERELGRLAQTAEYSSDAVISADRDRRIRRWNKGAERVFGWSAEEAIGRTGEELGMYDERHPPDAGRIVTVLAGGAGYHDEAQRRRKDGNTIETLTTVVPWRENGVVIGVTGVIVDITERKAAERELERLAQAAEHSSDAVISVDLDGRICHWSAGAEALLGFSAQETVGLTMADWNALSGEPEDADRRNSEFPARVYAGETIRYDVQRRRKDGAVLDLQATLVPWRVDGKIVGLTSTTVDITERKRAERARELALARLQEAQRLARLGSWTWDPQAGSATWSAQTYELFGRDPAFAPALGAELLSYVHPDDRERIRQLGANPPPGGFELDFRVRAGHDRSVRVLHAIGHPDPARPDCLMGTFQDVSAQRRGEQAQAANQAKTEFLSRMSHELRTPLNSISGFGQLLAMDDLQPRQAEYIGYVLKGAEHMLALVNDVLDLSRIEAGQLKVSPEPVALLDTVRGAVALVQPLADAGEVVLSLDTSGLAEGGHVHADAQRLKQVMLNVLSNAIKYNHPGGRVDVSFQTPDGSPPRLRTLVSDTGIGIAAHDIAKLFEPFERLGAEQHAIEGTGLGLALSKGLIEAMGGTINASSRHGLGSTFAIELARVAAPDAQQAHGIGEPQREQPVGAGLQPRRPKALYIEDNVSNLRLVERVLERHATVEMLPAMQGSIGLALAREHHPDIIILDLHLPDINGEVVLSRLKADPSTRDIPVIMLSADATKGLTERLTHIGSCVHFKTARRTPPLEIDHRLPRQRRAGRCTLRRLAGVG